MVMKQRPETNSIWDAHDSGWLLAGSLLLSAALCVSQIIGSTLLIAGVLLLLLGLMAAACSRGRVFLLLLYFLPWSPLMKLHSGGTSWFTIALLLCCLIALVKNGFRLRLYQLLLPAGLLALTMAAKAVQGNGLESSYLCFLAMLLLYPCLVERREALPSFWDLTVFFAAGIISAALTAQFTAGYGNISHFITVYSIRNITRLSGFYGDPNFYSAHVTACLAGIGLLLCREPRRLRQLLLALLALVLLYCGLLSASKSFVLVMACLMLVWIPMLMERRTRGSTRVRVLLGLLCAVAIVLSSSAFQELLRMMDDRFSNAVNVSNLTTGRTELWLRYLRELAHNAGLTLLGQGYSNVHLGGRASHNTLIQGVYQFGLVGLPLLVAWFCGLLRRERQTGPVARAAVLLLCIGVTMPWLGLDMLFFDEIFLLPVYAAVGVSAFSARPAENTPPEGADPGEPGRTLAE